jgi:hypothetical protein
MVTATTSQEEANWRAEFEREGEAAIRAHIEYFSGPKKMSAIRWLREKEKVRERRDEENALLLRWTFGASLAAVVIGIIGVLAARYWH